MNFFFFKYRDIWFIVFLINFSCKIVMFLLVSAISAPDKDVNGSGPSWFQFWALAQESGPLQAPKKSSQV